MRSLRSVLSLPRLTGKSMISSFHPATGSAPQPDLHVQKIFRVLPMTWHRAAGSRCLSSWQLQTTPDVLRAFRQWKIPAGSCAASAACAGTLCFPPYHSGIPDHHCCTHLKSDSGSADHILRRHTRQNFHPLNGRRHALSAFCLLLHGSNIPLPGAVPVFLTDNPY